MLLLDIFLLTLLLSGCQPKPEAQAVQESELRLVFLPMVMAGDQEFGVESERTMCGREQWYNPHSALKISVRWSEVEQTQGYYNWSYVDQKLCGYEAAWISVKLSPAWALPLGDPPCKLPQREFWPEAAQFYQALIDRYKPEYLGIWNEPDIAGWTAGTQDYLGCVGNGTLYGEFVDFIHANVSGSRIILGEVANPDNDFSRDALAAADNGYDGFSFHCYPRLYDDGFVEDCDARYELASAMTTKPVYNSETAVYYVSGTEEEFEAAQIEHFNLMLESPTVWFWYTLANHGWPWHMPGDLVVDDIPRPVWYLYDQQR